MQSVVSIIIPVYNSSRTIKRCLESIYSQTYQKLEVIIVDDESTDNSRCIINQFIRSHQLLSWQLISIINSGVAAARNTGLKFVTGQYVCFIDSDDYVSNLYVEKMVSALEECNSEWCVAGFVKVLQNNGTTVEEQKSNIQAGYYRSIWELCDYQNFFIDGFIHPCWSKLYQTKIIKEYNLKFPEKKLSEDTLFNLGYMEKCQSVCLINDALYHYVNEFQNESLSKSIPETIFDDYVYIHKEFVNFFEKSVIPIDIETVDRMMYAQYYTAAYKILFSQRISRNEKKKMLNHGFHYHEIRKCFAIKQGNITVNMINWMFCNRWYRCAMAVLKMSMVKRERIT